MSERDRELKLRFERILWSAGFYTRTNVILAAPTPSRGKGRKSAAELTDVDVLGIRFLEDLSPRKVVADCKSGRRVSPISRAFWLRGVMQHFGADRGYVVLARDIPDHQREAAANLAISLVPQSSLDTLDSQYESLPVGLRIGTADAYLKLEDNLLQLPNSLTPLLNFRDTTFWYQTSPRAMTQAITLTRRLSGKLDLSHKYHKALLLDIISLFSLSIIAVGGELLRLGPEGILDSIRALIFGGAEGITRRRQLIRGFEGILQKVSQQNPLLPNDAAMFDLDPPYLHPIADMIVRVLARPIESSEIPRYLRVRLIQGVLYEEWDIQQFFGDKYSQLADKLAADLAITFLKSCDFDLEAARKLGFQV